MMSFLGTAFQFTVWFFYMASSDVEAMQKDVHLPLGVHSFQKYMGFGEKKYPKLK